MHWLHQVRNLFLEKTPFVIVSIVNVIGTSPDDAGTKLIVTKTNHYGTLNTSNRRAHLIAQARSVLNIQACWSRSVYELNEVAGAENGTYEVFFQYFDALEYPNGMEQARNSLKNEQLSVLVSLFDSDNSKKIPEITVSDGSSTQSSLYPLNHLIIQILRADNGADTVLHQLENSKIVLLQKIHEPEHSVVVIGQSPVSTSLVTQLLLLPIKILWLGGINDKPPEHDQLQRAELCDDNIRGIRPGSSVAIATGSHELDIRCCFTALEHPSLNFIGCLGSKKKSALVRKQLLEQGTSAENLQKLQMPIGLPSICGKQPSIIAASIVAQILGAR